MAFAVVLLTNRADHVTEGAKPFLTVSAVGGMGIAENMRATGVAVAMVGAEVLPAKLACCAAMGTVAGLTLGARLHRCRQRPILTTGTLNKTTVTVGGVIYGAYLLEEVRMVDHFIKAGTNRALTSAATDQTTLAKALAAGAANVNLRTILSTPGTVQCTIATDVCRLAAL